MALTEDQTRLLGLYHDYLRSAGLVVCERAARPDGTFAHRPVLGRRGKELIEGFARSREAQDAEEQEQASSHGAAEEMTDTDAHRLHQTMDAKEWAHAFMRLIVDPGVPIDEGLMIGWFANAIMTGWDFSAAGSSEGAA